MHRMSPLDASFLHIEDDRNQMHIGSAAIFEGPAPDFGTVRSMIAGRLPLAQRYRQVVRRVPLDLGRPVWVDDHQFNLDYHVRHTALPPPGSGGELRSLMSRIMSQHLDRRRPLWEMWMVECLEDNHWALVSKTHHAMVDGIAGTDLLALLLDDEPEPAPAVPDNWRAEPSPSDVRLLGDALIDYVATPYEQWRAVLRSQRAAKDTVRRNINGLSALIGVVGTAPDSPLVGPIGPHRTYDWARGSFADVRIIRGAFGGTVNDVVLTAVTRGYRDLLLSRGEDVAGQVVRTLVPVSIRTPAERGPYDNKVSAMVAELPVHIDDPHKRLISVREQMQGVKASDQAVAAETLTRLSGFAPPLLLALGARAATRVAHRLGPTNVHTVTTNVPGPRRPLYALGRRLIEALPYVPIASPMRVGVAIFSYDDAFTFGLTGDLATTPDLHVLGRGIEDGLSELVKSAESA